MKSRLSHIHWGLVLMTAIVVYILTFILGLGVSLLLLTLPNRSSQSTFQAFSLITALLVIGVTGYGAWWVARKVEHAALLHGFLVGLAVALISLVLDLFFRRELNPFGLVLYVLMIAAGLLGGVLGSIRREQS